jgi:ubiquinone/menaquinone biosynthesis C-methylase UbiE
MALVNLENKLDSLLESHLDLQVNISYFEHHDFMTRHQLNECTHILDVGTGNGTFIARLAHDHPCIHFFGIDKRKHCIESCEKIRATNLNFEQVDLFSSTTQFDFSRFDGFLMRYFLLHVDHSKKILALFKTKAKKPMKFWIIDLDFSQFFCEPKNSSFDKMTNLVKEFCAKTSIDSMAGYGVVPILQDLGYQNIVVENAPFSTKNIPLEALALYLKQEMQCYSRMMGRAIDDPEILEMTRFIDEDFRSGKFQISYGMILIYAEIN